MYYEEKEIDGVKYYRTSPDGEWKRLRCTCSDFDGFVDCPVHI